MRKLLAWWINLHRRGAVAGRRRAVALFEAIRRVQQARADRELLARLDSRTLKDIGLESWNAHLAERVHVHRERKLLRVAASRIGVY
jgi:uncharacterized protein YjiS (DUF1127 family)